MNLLSCILVGLDSSIIKVVVDRTLRIVFNVRTLMQPVLVRCLLSLVKVASLRKNRIRIALAIAHESLLRSVGA